MKKRLLALFMAVAMMTGIMVVPASAGQSGVVSWDTYMTADKNCIGTAEETVWMTLPDGSEGYVDVTYALFPNGTTFYSKSAAKYPLRVYFMETGLSQIDWNASNNGAFIKVEDDNFTLVNDSTAYKIIINDQGNKYLTFVKGAPAPKTDNSSTGTGGNASAAEGVGYGTKEYYYKIFDDVPVDSWYADSVVHLYNLGIMAGVSSTQFAPQRTVTNAMVWVMLARLAGVNLDGGTNWYSKAQSWVINNGLDDGKGANEVILREDILRLMHNFCEYKGLASKSLITIWTGEYVNNPGASYNDWNQVSDNCKDAVDFFLKAGVISGTSTTTLSPKGQVTRAQLAKIFSGFINTWGPELYD